MMSKSTLDKLIRVFFWGAVISLGLLLAQLAHGSTKEQKTCWLPEGCVIQYQDNPFTYKVGSWSLVGVVDKNIVLRVQPLATYSLFTEDILFCGQPDLFEGKKNPLVLTYKTRASHAVQGIGCHDLIRVDEMVQP
jgi:hypothetical protein